ncbi:RNA polymerase sigma factor [Sphingobacterium hungaricum]|uniref:RNA polymerase sigma-70 factor, ECF subfamily n=1 Tax=Sphingobacterium hungaricum TaxID=2082723 RepID=A0A928YQK7_9SPHI|nr:sigma-70 family RNA polymerase sigma factor [Sphingobacterium hungaricum]MBE8714341.1 hypothetical protein [Sphingobacterium hungaricum]
MNRFKTEISEKEFVKFREGDPSVFRKIFDLFHKPIFHYIYSFTKNREDSEELVQEVFTTLFLKRDSLTDSSGLYPYLFVVSKRMMISDFRKRVVKAKYRDHLAQEWSEESRITEEQIHAADLSRTLELAMNELSVKEQEVYRLNKLEGFSYHEIADRSGVSKNTIKNQLISASKKIKWKIEKIYSLIFFLFFL